jgi:hypothetical protein
MSNGAIQMEAWVVAFAIRVSETPDAKMGWQQWREQHDESPEGSEIRRSMLLRRGGHAAGAGDMSDDARTTWIDSRCEARDTGNSKTAGMDAGTIRQTTGSAEEEIPHEDES